MSDQKIERKIIIGMIVSKEFLQNIRPYFSTKYLQSATAKRIARWCMEYYDKQNDAPGRNIETIFYVKVKEDKLPEEIAEEIEMDILPDLSEEFEQQESFNVGYHFEQAREYFQEKHLELFTEQINALIQSGDVEGAKKLANEYKPIAENLGTHIDLNDPRVLDIVDQIFNHDSKPIIKLPRAFGELMNDQLVRGGFVAFMASEKRGKSYMLLELANRAVKQGCKVAFFQAGDMTEGQQIRRIMTYHARQPRKPIEKDKQFISVRDCIHNQMDECDKDERECDHGIFTKQDVSKMGKGGIRSNIEYSVLVKKFDEYPDYISCTNCKLFQQKKWGTVWLKPNNPPPLTAESGKRALQKFFIDKKRQFRLSSHANGTLSVKEIESLLSMWEKQDDFVPDVIIVDYADLLVAEGTEFRHSQNEIWKGLRRLSQSKTGQAIRLVVTVTQADAKSYDQNRLKLSNFSEDKRKYAHVTAMYGLNQDPGGREKMLGIIRVNELVVREGEFYTTREVCILQNINTGQPLISSFW